MLRARRRYAVVHGRGNLGPIGFHGRFGDGRRDRHGRRRDFHIFCRIGSHRQLHELARLTIDEFAFEAIAVLAADDAVAVRKVVVPLTIVLAAVRPVLHAVAFGFAVEPFATVAIAVGPDGCAFAVELSRLPGTLELIARGRRQRSRALHGRTDRVAFIMRAVRPFDDNMAVAQFALVECARERFQKPSLAGKRHRSGAIGETARAGTRPGDFVRLQRRRRNDGAACLDVGDAFRAGFDRVGAHG